jgi:hypothetical protein
VLIHFLASQRHYAEHLLPIWEALDPDERGWFIATSRDAWRWLGARGVSARLHRGTMPMRRTLLDGKQPPWVVASYSDLVSLGPRRRAVLVEHGAGQHYGGDGGTAATLPYHAGGTERGTVDCFLCPNEVVAYRNANVYPNARALAVGCPKLDSYRSDPADRDAVVFAWHWQPPLAQSVPESGSAFPEYAVEVEALASSGRWPVVGHGHPRGWSHFESFYRGAGIEPVRELRDALARARVLVADNTSAMWEAAALDVPVVVVNSKRYRRDVDHGLRFWEFADVGPQVDDPTQLADAIERALDADEWAERRDEIACLLYGERDGGGAARAVEEIRATYA